MNNQAVLSKLEHHLLSSMMDDIEPLYVLYAETIRDIEEANLDLILEALVKLTESGFIRCFFEDNKPPHARTHCKNLTAAQLKKHCSHRSERELQSYPEHRAGEYEFKATPKGEFEAWKDIYKKYYCDND